jgi:hypothetical protein
MAEERPTLSTINAIVTRLEKRLFGNGQPGVIQELQAADDSNKRDIASKHQDNQKAIGVLVKDLDEFKELIAKYKWIGVGIILASGFFTGSGMASLEHLMKLLGH